mmetsp:Transcript_67524/g.173914  ORF Transcript_67524/g.173914 Transcript_67524/m.173914 type:complete len:233 (+) Transcript_67524:35-733(+)
MLRSSLPNSSLTSSCHRRMSIVSPSTPFCMLRTSSRISVCCFCNSITSTDGNAGAATSPDSLCRRRISNCRARICESNSQTWSLDAGALRMTSLRLSGSTVSFGAQARHFASSLSISSNCCLRAANLSCSRTARITPATTSSRIFEMAPPSSSTGSLFAAFPRSAGFSTSLGGRRSSPHLLREPPRRHGLATNVNRVASSWQPASRCGGALPTTSMGESFHETLAFVLVGAL